MSRGMADFDDMCLVCEEPMTEDQLRAEMKQCETVADTGEWETCVDEIFERPDVHRTTFLWQIEADADSDIEDDFEQQDSQWRCLPSMWQSMLNHRLADHHGRVQDAEALWRHRLATFGPDDIKTKNAHAKFSDLMDGKGSTSVILISKITGKEVSSEVYKKSVKNANGELKVSLSARTSGFKFAVSSMTLQALTEEAPEKHLRIVSVTGRSRDIQEIRLHLTYLSLHSSKVVKDLKLNRGGNSKSCTADDAHLSQESHEKGEPQGGEAGQVEQALADMAEGDVGDFEVADGDLVANHDGDIADTLDLFGDDDKEGQDRGT